ncbi:NUDIX domain-containing protein [Solihabitans fulvus]|uniref:NUDIX domain-containing protein n=1 Tax=Solihabitans fulvus TaxID=1892852 RepID=A0A5B2XS35_9PSEU|nr:NUDIX domain-containing protein [Solihabitans fulvus]KAA2266507.1 NUDIX domain-containing protein [Solihabitans fulvus]
MSAKEELVAVYDAAGNPVGSASRARMRAEGLWHAATAVLVRSPDGRRVYVHLRTADKDVFPGMYDCWSGGVVAAGEEPWDCAEREVAEELGVRGVPLRHLFDARYDVDSVRYHAFVFEVTWDGPVTHQPEEVVSGAWMELTELRARLADPAWPLVPDGRLFVEEWFRRLDAGELS